MMNEDYQHLRTLLAPVYGPGEAQAIAFLVMEEVFGLSRTDIYAGKVSQNSEDERRRFVNICQSLAQGLPVQYALGTAEFCSRRFRVTPDVLIPRPETEELVAWAVASAHALQQEPATDPRPLRPLRLLDAGTGSGCIAVSLKLALPDAEVTAWDLSPAALEVARGNARQLGADVHFEQHDLLAPWPEQPPFDLIVSNPPYICQSEQADMEAHVLDHEPHLALFVPDADPLRFYRALAQAAQHHLASHGCLLVEANRAYARQTAELFRQSGLQHTQVRRDAFGNERMVGAWR